MGANIHQLQQSLDALEEKSAQIAQEIYSLYQSYLEALGQSVSKQLVHAAYHLCTQAKADAFLALSLNQQQSLQQGLQRLGHQLQRSVHRTLVQTIATNITRIDPNALVLASQTMEDAITAALRQVSREANHLLHDHEIIKIQSMETLFKIAAKADEAGRPITSPPHLLKALVETEEEEEEPNVPVVAIYLQITDIELADTELMGWRHQLRQTLQKVMALNKDCSQKQETLATAKAEAAWRASWFPYDPEADLQLLDDPQDDSQENDEPAIDFAQIEDHGDAQAQDDINLQNDDTDLQIDGDSE